MVDDVGHFLHHQFPQFLGARVVYRGILSKFRQIQGFFYPQTVEFDPHVFPGKTFIGKIGVDLPGEDQKPLPAFDGKGLGDLFGVICHQSSCT